MEKQQFFVTQENRELITAVKNAACEYFGATESELLTNRKLSLARHLCYYILNEAGLNFHPELIGSFFNSSRGAVRHGIDHVETQKTHYRDVQQAIRGITNKVATHGILIGSI